MALLIILGLSVYGAYADPVPSPWSDQTIGTETTMGSADYNPGTGEFTVDGSGADIWGTADNFHFVHQQVSGNFTLIARVVSISTGASNWRKAGIMIRNDLTAGSANTFIAITGGDGGGETFQRRETAGGSSVSSHVHTDIAPPQWIKLIRIDNSFEAWFAPDDGGAPGTWVQEGTAYTVVMADPVQVGLALTSHTAGELVTAVYDNITIDLQKTASNPTPTDGALNPSSYATMQWSPGATAVSHDVYFGTDYDDVANGTGGTFQGNQLGKFFVVGFAPYPYPDGLPPGIDYYWRIDEVEADGVTKYAGDVWSFFVPPNKAYDPDPVDGIAVVDPDATLTWSSGYGALVHYVYFSDDYDTVANAPENAGELAPDTSFTPPGPLENNKTYYWRVDESNPPDQKYYKGNVWSFTTGEPGLGTIVMERWEGIDTTDLNTLKNDARFPGNPDVTENLTEFRWDVTDLDTYGARIYGWVYAPMTGDYTFYLATDDTGELFLSSNEDPENSELIASLSAWSSIEEFTKYTSQTSAVIPLVAGEKYYIEALWKENTGGDHCNVAWQGPGIPTTTTIAGNYLAPFLPVKAYSANPINRATGVNQHPELIWKAGMKAASHQFYFGTDETAVANATTTSPEYKGVKGLGEELHDPGALDWDKTYYWRVDEVNTVEPDSPWKGTVWSFTTADYLIIDGFEDYNDEPPDRVFETWLDGFGGTTNGSIAGYPYPVFDDDEHFCETTIVHGGKQSMPFFYDNNLKYSEVTKTLVGSDRNWTQHGLKALSFWYYGHIQSQGSFVEGPAGTYTMTGAGSDIYGTADEFHYAWKVLSGTGSIIAKVESLSISNTEPWVKAGVMIRNTLDPNSSFGGLYITTGNGCRYQARTETAGDGSSDSSVTTLAHIEAPHWIKLERTISGDFNAYDSNDGQNWFQLAWNPVNISMNQSVYIGLAVTSHTANVPATAVFSNVSTTGNVTGATFTNQDIGILSNTPERMYVSIKDNTGQKATVYNPDANAANVTAWTQWGQYGQGITLSEFTAANPSLNLANIDSISLGFGTFGNSTQPGGSGLMFIDDIRLEGPKCVYQLAKPDNDFSNNCVVDMPDLEILTDNWLNQPPELAETVWGGAWANSDIGAVDAVGSFTINGSDNFTITGSGADIWGTGDEFHYASQPLSGDGQITIRINSIDETNVWSKAGVMIRDDAADPNSAHAMMVVTSASGASFQWREAANESSNSSTTGGITAPVCLRLVRQGNTITGYFSTANGWVQQGSVEIPMTDPVNIGIAVTSHSDGSLCTATGDRECPAMFLFTDLNQDGVTDFKDYAALIDDWLTEVLWPQ